MVRQTPGAIARALEFAILTASREGMVRGPAWEEIKWKDLGDSGAPDEIRSGAPDRVVPKCLGDC
jgi:hypothetical protein